MLRRENRGSVNRLGEFTSSTKRKIEHVHAIVSQQRQKIYVKKCAAVFLPFSLPSPSSLLKAPNTELHEKKVTHSRLDCGEILCLKIGRGIE